MRINLRGSVHEVLRMLEEFGIETLQKRRGVTVSGYEYYIEDAIQTEVYDRSAFSPSRETLNVTMFMNKSKSKSQEELAAEAAVRRAKENLEAAEATLKKIKEKK